ncbi:MAG: ferredoxin family protein [Eubacteriales bacterium]|nr:ferredoxin family protein [Eubacteriales bacterium]
MNWEELKKVSISVTPVPSSVRPIIYDQEKCIGCNRCAEVCQCDILLPSEKKGEHPIVMYPGECYYCGACVMVCPKKGAIRLEHPLMNRARFVEVRGK